MKNTDNQGGLKPVRADAEAKAAGRERYAADYYGPDLLWAGAKRAGAPHARIKAVHVEAARTLPGVKAVLNSGDVKGSNRQGVIRRDQPVLADDKVRHAGDAVALVVAEDRRALAQALALIQVEYEELPGVFDPEAALKPGAPLIHEDSPTGNLLLEGRVATGKGAQALDECAAVVEAAFDLPRQEHAYLETEAGWARLDQDGRLVIVASTQTPFRDRAEVAEALGLDLERLRVIAPHAGGAFGGKDGVSVQSLLGLAALACPGRLVKMWLGREESFLSSPKRHPARLRYRLGARRDGTLHALEADFTYDTGAYDHLGGAVMTLGLEHAGGPYRIPNVSLRGRAVYTNNPVSGAFRGFGVPQVAAAMEQALDMLAARLGLDPVEMRLRNALRTGDLMPIGATLNTSAGLVECLRQIQGHPLWIGRQAWKKAAGAFARRGVGVAAVFHAMGYGPLIPDVGQAKLELTREGRFRLYCGVVDMGQGNAGTFLQMAGRELGLPAEQIELVMPDTDLCLRSGSASASRTTYTFGNAVIGAARDLRKRLMEQAADLLMVREVEEMALAPEAIRHVPSGREVPLNRLAKLLDPAQRVAVSRWRAPVSSERPSNDQALILHGLPHAVFSFAAHLAAVEIDELTGRVAVKDYVAVTDCGRVMNRQLVEQQIQGGVLQGLGWALLEDMPAEKGIIGATDLATYIIPTSVDAPVVECRFVEKEEPSGPYGMKGAGEVAIDGPLPAVANALADATGARLTRFPANAERVLALLPISGGSEE